MSYLSIFSFSSLLKYSSVQDVSSSSGMYEGSDSSCSSELSCSSSSSSVGVFFNRFPGIPGSSRFRIEVFLSALRLKNPILERLNYRVPTRAYCVLYNKEKRNEFLFTQILFLFFRTCLLCRKQSF